MPQFFAVLLVSLVCSVSIAREALYVPETESQRVAQALTIDDPLVQEVGRGFVAAIGKENTGWYYCGAMTKKEDYEERGLKLALALRIALLEVGLKDPMYLWGAAALVFHESRGNPCVTGPRSRDWVREKKLLKKEVPWVLYTESDIFRIVRSKDFKSRKSGIDSGIAQTLYPGNAFVYDTTERKVRRASIEEMVTVEGGSRATAYHMLEKAVESPKYPWMYWPGARDDRYAQILAIHVRRMGGPHTEMFPHCRKRR